MPNRQVQKDLSITRFELMKRVLVVVGLASFMLLGLMITGSNPKTGWFGVALFGTMTILAAMELVKLRDHKIVKDAGTNQMRTVIQSGFEQRHKAASEASEASDSA